MIGDRIKHLRLQNKTTQEELAKHLHISPQAISKWEQHISTPDISLLIPLADFFGVTTDFLLKDQTNPKVSEIASLVEIKFQKRGSAFHGYVRNNSAFNIRALNFKIKFKDMSGHVIDYKEEAVYNLGANEQKQLLVFSQVAKEIVETDFDILNCSAT